MYTATLDACNAYRVRDSSGTFVRRLYKYNFFHVKRKLRVLLANNNAVLNSCFKNKEQLETSHDELIMEDKLQNTNFMSMEEKFLSFLHTRKYYNAKVKKAILLKYHGYKEEHITKITKISKTNLHSYLKYFQSNFRKKVLNNNYNSNNKNNRKFN
jgi:predicted DNA-binding ArsR family transcriptional regulator